ncbi:MAG: SDR family NAD(P)-dependent oxidoreductase [Erysipelotrichaceae bacterium]|nr:SDR family NAD(P)-dependent oxidoreductase [Erysipelotrichaceae bacterium]
MIQFNDLKQIDLSHTKVVITGANNGLGFETARYFAINGAQVFMTSRSEEKGKAAILKIKEETPNAKLVLMSLDLASIKSIENFSREMHKNKTKIDILINNAGIMAVPYALTEDGYESQIGVNHLGHFRLTALLWDLLSDKARIVNLSSMAHKQGSLNFTNFMYEKGGYSSFGSYSRSKLSNLVYTIALGRRVTFSGSHIVVVAAHPGVAKTGLFDTGKRSKFIQFFINLFLASVSSAEDGAKPTIMAALDPQAISGNFYGPDKKTMVKLDTPKRIALSKQAQDDLWAYSVDITKVTYPF